MSGKKHATRPGNYFVSNYPPYSFWSAGAVDEARAALERPPRPDTPLLPLCRKLLRVDALLPGFFLPQHRTERVV